MGDYSLNLAEREVAPFGVTFAEIAQATTEGAEILGAPDRMTSFVVGMLSDDEIVEIARIMRDEIGEMIAEKIAEIETAARQYEIDKAATRTLANVRKVAAANEHDEPAPSDYAAESSLTASLDAATELIAHVLVAAEAGTWHAAPVRMGATIADVRVVVDVRTFGQDKAKA